MLEVEQLARKVEQARSEHLRYRDLYCRTAVDYLEATIKCARYEQLVIDLAWYASAANQTPRLLCAHEPALVL